MAYCGLIIASLFLFCASVTLTEGGVLSTDPVQVLVQPMESVQLRCQYQVTPGLSCEGSYLFWYHGSDIMVMNNTVPKRPRYTASLEQDMRHNETVECTYTLNINNVLPKDAGTYACIFIWYEGYYHYEQVTSDVHVLHRPKPKYPICSKKITTLHADSEQKSLAFVCQSELTADGVWLRWRNGHQLLEARNNVSEGMLVSKYMMNGSSVIPHDMHEYVCEIMYKNMSLGQSCTIQATMGVVIKSHYHIKDNPTDSYATFTCTVNMSIPGVGFRRTWYIHGRKIDPHDVNDRFLVDSHAGELHVRNITKMDSHEHIQCLVTSILGNGSADALMVVAGEDKSIFKDSKAPYNGTLIAALVGGALGFVILVNLLLCFVKGKSNKAKAKYDRRSSAPNIDNRPPVYPELLDNSLDDSYQYAETPYMRTPKCSLSDDFPYLTTGVRKLSQGSSRRGSTTTEVITVSANGKNDYINMNKPRSSRHKLMSEDEYESMDTDADIAGARASTDSGMGSGRGSACSNESAFLKSVDINHEYYQAIRQSRGSCRPTPIPPPLPKSNRSPSCTQKVIDERAPTLPRKEGKKLTAHDYEGLDEAGIRKDSVYMKLKKKQKQDDSHIYENIN